MLFLCCPLFSFLPLLPLLSSSSPSPPLPPSALTPPFHPVLSMSPSRAQRGRKRRTLRQQQRKAKTNQTQQNKTKSRKQKTKKKPPKGRLATSGGDTRRQRQKNATKQKTDQQVWDLHKSEPAMARAISCASLPLSPPPFSFHLSPLLLHPPSFFFSLQTAFQRKPHHTRVACSFKVEQGHRRWGCRWRQPTRRTHQRGSAHHR